MPNSGASGVSSHKGVWGGKELLHGEEDSFPLSSLLKNSFSR